MQSYLTFDELQKQNFLIREDTLPGGEVAFLVTPSHIGTKFTQANKIYRSSMWNKYGKLISAGFPKFVNLGENQEHFPDPDSGQLRHARWTQKLDGSLLICSFYNGQFIYRTRGTFDARTLANGWELDELLAKYQSFLDLLKIHEVSFLFEWTTPNNKIVLDYPEPKLTLVGGVSHRDYSLFTQDALDELARTYGLNRPEMYDFSDCTLTEAAAEISLWENNEGVCVYFKNAGQWEIKKIKSAEYLRLHAFKSEMTEEKLLDLYIHAGRPSFEGFSKYIQDNYDYESFMFVYNWISRIIDADKELRRFLNGAEIFITKNNLYKIPRKDAALAILSAYGNTGRSGVLFGLLDGKPLYNQQYKMLYMQLLKKV